MARGIFLRLSISLGETTNDVVCFEDFLLGLLELNLVMRELIGETSDLAGGVISCKRDLFKKIQQC
jgi:hypothetical protein